MLDLFDEVWHLMITAAFPASSSVVGGSRRLIRALPDPVLREAIVNAIMHRDYRLPMRSIVVHALGASSAKIRSPGGLVAGVSVDRLITSPSVTRNPKLAGAMRSLGLAEREGAGDVLVSLRGGAPDVSLVTFFEELAARDPALEEVRAAMAVTSLLACTPLRADELARQAQCTVDEAHDTLERLERAGVVTRLLNRSRAFQFSATARKRFVGRTHYPTRRRLDEHQDLVRAYLDTVPEISRDDAASLLGVTPNSASRILSDLAREGVLQAVANTRGRGVRYRDTAP
jgi:ATP-dependent DNA helicase RecG